MKMRDQSGITIIEIIIALGVFSLLSAAIVSLALSGHQLLGRSEQLAEAGNLANAGYEAVRSIRDRAWNELVFDQARVYRENGAWHLAGDNVPEKIGKYSREVYFLPVYRDGSFEIVASGTLGAWLDPESKEVLVRVLWTGENGETRSVKRHFFLTDWSVRDNIQSDWSGGSGQEFWSDNSRYFVDDGNVSVAQAGVVRLNEIATSTYAISGMLESSAFESAAESICVAVSWDYSAAEECPECEIRMQVQSAPDAGGQPGQWSLWSGPDGRDDGDETDYFTDSRGGVIHRSHNPDRWFRYRVLLSGNGSASPSLHEVKMVCSR